MTHRLTVDIQGYWHIGSGQGGGPGADALVARTPGGLPCLPGRALKGLLRDAVHQAWKMNWFSCSKEDLVTWFGSELVSNKAEASEALEEARFSTTDGALIIESARIGADDESAADWEAWAAHADAPGASDDAREEIAAFRAKLFQQLASTRIDADGLARDQTLRSIEVAVPMTLHAPIQGPPEALAAIRASLTLIRALGVSRTRGLGRVQMRLEEV